MDTDAKGDLTEFVTVSFKDSSSKNSSSSLESAGKPESQKFSEKVTRKLQSGKRKVLSIASNGRDTGLESSVEEPPPGAKGSVGVKGSEGVKGLENGESVDGPVVSKLSAIKDGSHSATSSPQRQVKGENRQRALSDTSLHKVSTVISSFSSKVFIFLSYRETSILQI